MIKLRRTIRTRHLDFMENVINLLNILFRRSEGEEPLGRPTGGCEGMLQWLAIVSVVMMLQVS
jgi:hypothetical protein